MSPRTLRAKLPVGWRYFLAKRCRACATFLELEKKDDKNGRTAKGPLQRDIEVECFYSITRSANLLTTYLTHDLHPCLPFMYT